MVRSGPSPIQPACASACKSGQDYSSGSCHKAARDSQATSALQTGTRLLVVVIRWCETHVRFLRPKKLPRITRHQQSSDMICSISFCPKLCCLKASGCCDFRFMICAAVKIVKQQSLTVPQATSKVSRQVQHLGKVSTQAPPHLECDRPKSHSLKKKSLLVELLFTSLRLELRFSHISESSSSSDVCHMWHHKTPEFLAAHCWSSLQLHLQAQRDKDHSRHKLGRVGSSNQCKVSVVYEFRL